MTELGMTGAAAVKLAKLANLLQGLGIEEFRVEMGNEDMWVAVTWVGADAAVTWWPLDLTQAEVDPLYGPRSGPETFDPESWMLVAPVG